MSLWLHAPEPSRPVCHLQSAMRPKGPKGKDPFRPSTAKSACQGIGVFADLKVWRNGSCMLLHSIRKAANPAILASQGPPPRATSFGPMTLSGLPSLLQPGSRRVQRQRLDVSRGFRATVTRPTRRLGPRWIQSALNPRASRPSA